MDIKIIDLKDELTKKVNCFYNILFLFNFMIFIEKWNRRFKGNIRKPCGGCRNRRENDRSKVSIRRKDNGIDKVT